MYKNAKAYENIYAFFSFSSTDQENVSRPLFSLVCHLLQLRDRGVVKLETFNILDRSK